MKICATMKKFPGGMMVIPLLIGCLVNTFIPQCLQIGGFTTALFKSGQATLVGLFIFCSGATINVRQVGQPLYKGAVLTILKLVIGVIIGYLLNMAFGPAGVLGLTPFAVIAAVTNSNGAIYTALAKEFGDETDMGAIAVLSLNDGPIVFILMLPVKRHRRKAALLDQSWLSVESECVHPMVTDMWECLLMVRKNLEDRQEKISSMV